MTAKHRSSAFRPHPLRCAIAISLALASLSAAAQAAEQNAAVADAGATRAWNLPAAPLADTLARIARDSGYRLSADPALVAGKTAAPVHGDLGAIDAARQALAGTGLELVVTEGGTLSVRPAPVRAKDGEATLAPVAVTASTERDGRTEGTGSYRASHTSTATKLNLSPRETPQTVTVVTRQQMDDFNMADVDSVLESTSGVYVFERGSNGAFYYSRGFSMQTQYDGLPNPIGIGNDNRNPSPDSAFLDRVEIQQGAAGLLSGAGEPGGTINMVRKKPTDAFQGNIQAQLGSWDKKRLVGDVSGPLLESRKIRGRAVVLWDKSDSFVDYVFDDKQGFYGIVDADLGATTTVSASVQYQKNEGRNSLGVPMGPDGSDLGLSRSSFFGNADSGLTKEYRLYTIGVEQKLPVDWSIKASYNWNETKVEMQRYGYLWGGPLNVATGNGLTLYQSRFLYREFDSKTLDVYASGPFELLGRRHELVVGGSSQEMQGATRNSGNRGTAVNIYDFDPTKLPDPAGTQGPLPPSDQTRQQGLYGVVRLNVADPLKIILGTRVSWYDYETSAGVRTFDENKVTSPYAGVVLDLNKWSSVYASYSDIFKPQNQKSSNGNVLEPIVGANYEIGVKGELLDGRLNASAAVFRLEQSNLAKRDDAFGNDPGNACGGWCYIAQDKVLSQGVDFGLSGEITRNWSFSGNYSYVESEYASGSQKGDPYRTSVPKQILRLSTAYRIPDSGWTLGGGFRVQSRFYYTGTSSGVAYRAEQGGFAIVNLMAKYRIDKQTELGVLVDNVFDRRYYASVENIYYVPYGEPRKFTATLKYSF